MSRTNVAYFSASHASQHMCLKPTIKPVEQVMYALQSGDAHDIIQLLQRGVNNLTDGELLWLDHTNPNWRQMLDD